MSARMPRMDYHALMNRKPGTIAYATTLVHDGEEAVILHHGNTIARVGKHHVTVDNCGYDTRTTSHRIDTILFENGTRVRCNIRNWLMQLTLPDGTVTNQFPATFDRP